MAFPHDGKKFKKGESGNPKGKPKGSIHLSTRIQQMLDDDEFKTELVSKDGKKVEFKGNPAEAIIKTAILRAMSGDKSWADWLAQNGYGTKHVFDGEVTFNPIEQIIEETGLRQDIEKIRNQHDRESDEHIPSSSESQT